MEKLYLKTALASSIGKEQAKAWFITWNTALQAIPEDMLVTAEGVAAVEAYLISRKMISVPASGGKVTLQRLIKGSTIRKDDALILIDIQHDFMEYGALPVVGASAILPLVDDLAYAFDNVILTQDWHPINHASFASNHGADAFTTTQLDYGEQVLWPNHCVMGSRGAEFSLGNAAVLKAQGVIRKGFRRDVDSYSAFWENDKRTSTGLAGMLKERGITRLYFAGLALDYCVAYSAMDAVAQGFEAVVILEACRGIDADIEKTARTLESAGVYILR